MAEACSTFKTSIVPSEYKPEVEGEEFVFPNISVMWFIWKQLKVPSISHIFDSSNAIPSFHCAVINRKKNATIGHVFIFIPSQSLLNAKLQRENKLSSTAQPADSLCDLKVKLFSSCFLTHYFLHWIDRLEWHKGREGTSQCSPVAVWVV